MCYNYLTPLQQPVNLCTVHPKASCYIWCPRRPGSTETAPLPPAAAPRWLEVPGWDLLQRGWLKKTKENKTQNDVLVNKSWRCKSNLEKKSCREAELHSRFWNCCAVYLVRRIPKPSISASRIPPIIAEPTMVNGPPRKKKTTYFLSLFSPFAFFNSLQFHKKVCFST